MKKIILSATLAILLLATFVVAAPVITTSGNFTVDENKTLTLPISITAADNGTTNITKSETFGSLTPNGGVNVGTSATFTWTPTFSDAGVYPITFTVKDSNSSSSTVLTVTVLDVPSQLTAPGILSLGDNKQARSNPLHDRKEDREVNITGQITLTNTGGDPITGLKGTPTPTGKFSSTDLNIKISFGVTTLSPGQSTAATVTVRIPENLDAVDAALKEVAFAVANIKFTSNEGSTATTELRLQAENQLDIHDGNVRVNDDTDDLDDGDRVKDVKPEDDIEITLEIENTFTNREDVQIEDVEVILEIDELDVDEEEDLGDLNADEKDEVTFRFEVDEDAEDGTYDGFIFVEGVDENGARHGVAWEIEFEVERKTHEIVIRTMTLLPSTVRCEQNVELTVSVRNIGQRDEDEVTIQIESEELGFGDVLNFIEIDEDDSESRRFNIPIPKDLKVGSHRVIVSAFYDSTRRTDRETILLTKAACTSDAVDDKPVTPPKVIEPPVVVEPEPPVIVISPPSDAGPTGSIVDKPSEEDEQGFAGSTGYVILLALAYLVVLAIGIFFVMKALKK